MQISLALLKSLAYLCSVVLFRINLNNKNKKSPKQVIVDMIQVSDKAKEQILTLLGTQGKDLNNTFLRVGVKGGGCSGLSYELSFDGELNESDKLIEDKGVRILVDKKSMLYLVGTILDYSDGLNGKGFAFQNPNATRTCGCGESFSV